MAISGLGVQKELPVADSFALIFSVWCQCYCN